jgi:ABC-type transport system involved in Fe-S cluster assembly fused permease/ATPase subunit
MAARAEITVAKNVYDHVQKQSLAFHLSRETGKIIRIVSRGSFSLERVLRQSTFNVLPILIESALTLIVFAALFDWKFMLI